MEDGLLSLKWNNHKSTFFHILSNLRKRESYTDATIACEGRFFPVHKLVMSTCSDYFCDIFQRTTCKAPVVILKDIRYQEVESLLDYMYLGEVDVKQSELAGLIKAAECLRIKGLAVPDEEPNSSSKRPNYLSENRLSPSAKRHRRDSDSSDDPHYYASQYSKGQSHSPIHQSATSSRSHSTSTPVPSQTADTEVLSQSMPPPPYSESRRATHQLNTNSNPLSSGEQFSHEDKDSAPLEFIKVELDDDKGDKCKEKSKSVVQTNLKDDSRGEGGGRLDGCVQEKQHALQNNYSEYCNSESDIDKEEPEQIETFNGSEIPGPSGVQGASQIMTWGEEEGSFPHNLFGTEDASHQQVSLLQDMLTRNNEAHKHLRLTRNFLRNSFDSSDEQEICSNEKDAQATFAANIHPLSAIPNARFCSHCGLNCRSMSELKRHIMTHTGEKPFQCPLCSYGSVLRANLRRHVVSKHSSTYDEETEHV